MDREFSFYLGKHLTKVLEKTLRNQLDLIQLILETATEIINPRLDTKKIRKYGNVTEEGIRIIYPAASKEKIQRIFFFNKYPEYNGKSMYTIQSLVFPFKITENTSDGEMKIWYRSLTVNIEFDSRVISQIKTVINIINDQELTWGDTWIYELLNLLHGSMIDGEKLFYIVNEFLTFDFGYLRFDNDPEHESENHPRYHIDIHLDNKATYKLGVYDILSTNEFIE